MSSKPSSILRERRREGPRARADIPAVAGTPRGQVEGVLHELSAGGCFLFAPPQPIGTSISLQFTVEGIPVACTGEVRYRLTKRQTQGMGIRFLDLSSVATVAIQTYLKTHTPIGDDRSG
jgi:hypothetical protein